MNPYSDYGYGTPGSSGGGGSGGFNWSSLIGGLGSIGSIIGSLMQSSSYSNTLGSLTNSLNQIIGPMTQEGQSLIGNFQNQVVPQLQNEYGTAMQQQGQSYGQVGQYGGLASGAAGALQNNPYLAQQGKTIGGLLNYQALTPAELASLTTGAGAAASSAAKTMAAQTGGVPNAALLEEQGIGQAGATASTTGVQLGTMAAEQHLQSLEAALQGQQAQGAQYLQGESAAAGVYSGLANTYAGLSESELQAALSASSIQSQELGVGANLQQGAAGDITSLLQQVYGSAQQNQGGFGGMMSGLTGLLGLLPMLGVA